jgi:hypothetical protein
VGYYPILQGQTDEAYEARRNGTPYPRSVPWDLVKDHDKQAQSNHSQTLTRLAERGGVLVQKSFGALCTIRSSMTRVR